MPPVVELACAQREDLPAVQRLAGIVWRAHYPEIISAEQIDYMLERGYALDALAGFLGREDRGLELARVDGALAGFAAWYRTDAAGEVKLDKLYVLAAHQRLGLGGRLIARVAAFARAAGGTTLLLNVNKRNRQAIAAYAKHGFQVREAVVIPIGEGFVMDDYVMARPLDAPASAG
jgi:ribosomal protein S18 acetylase RimI-like enzyme